MVISIYTPFSWTVRGMCGWSPVGLYNSTSNNGISRPNTSDSRIQCTSINLYTPKTAGTASGKFNWEVHSSQSSRIDWQSSLLGLVWSYFFTMAFVSLQLQHGHHCRAKWPTLSHGHGHVTPDASTRGRKSSYLPGKTRSVRWLQWVPVDHINVGEDVTPPPHVRCPTETIKIRQNHW